MSIMCGTFATGAKTYLFDLKNITRDDFCSFNFLELTVTKNSGLESESLLQFGDDGTCLVFLNETDSGVEQEQGADDTEVDPILKTGSKHGSGLFRVVSSVVMP